MASFKTHPRKFIASQIHCIFVHQSRQPRNNMSSNPHVATSHKHNRNSKPIPSKNQIIRYVVTACSSLLGSSAVLPIGASHLLGACCLLARFASDCTLGFVECSLDLVLQMWLSLVMGIWCTCLFDACTCCTLLGSRSLGDGLWLCGTRGGCLALSFGSGGNSVLDARLGISS